MASIAIDAWSASLIFETWRDSMAILRPRRPA